MQNKNDEAAEKAMRLAKSPAGQQLLQLMQKSGSDQLQQAMESAKSGDYSAAQRVLSELLDDPQAQKLLSQLGR